MKKKLLSLLLAAVSSTAFANINLAEDGYGKRLYIQGEVRTAFGYSSNVTTNYTWTSQTESTQTYSGTKSSKSLKARVRLALGGDYTFSNDVAGGFYLRAETSASYYRDVKLTSSLSKEAWDAFTTQTSTDRPFARPKLKIARVYVSHPDYGKFTYDTSNDSRLKLPFFYQAEALSLGTPDYNFVYAPTTNYFKYESPKLLNNKLVVAFAYGAGEGASATRFEAVQYQLGVTYNFNKDVKLSTQFALGQNVYTQELCTAKNWTCVHSPKSKSVDVDLNVRNLFVSRLDFDFAAGAYTKQDSNANTDTTDRYYVAVGVSYGNGLRNRLAVPFAAVELSYETKTTSKFNNGKSYTSYRQVETLAGVKGQLYNSKYANLYYALAYKYSHKNNLQRPSTNSNYKYGQSYTQVNGHDVEATLKLQF